MITGIFNAITAIVDFISMIYNVVVDLIKDLIQTVALCGQALAYAVGIIGVLPSIWITALTACVTIWIIFRIKG